MRTNHHAGHVVAIAAVLIPIVFSPVLASASGTHPTGIESIVKRPPQSITARRIGPWPKAANLKFGTSVPGAEVWSRSFANTHDGFALGGPLGGVYPVRTTDGGAEWKIDGPLFANATADGAVAVQYTGTAGDSTEFAYGGGSAVDVSANAGKTWWQAFPGELVLDVIDRDDLLSAIVQQQTTSQGTTAVTWVYLSADGGRHWRFSNRLDVK